MLVPVAASRRSASLSPLLSPVSVKAPVFVSAAGYFA